MDDFDELGVVVFFLIMLLASFGVGRCSQVGQPTDEATATVLHVTETMQAEPHWYLTARDDTGNYYAGNVKTLVKPGWRVRIKAYHNKILELNVLLMGEALPGEEVR